ncbi:hypothetical protein P691DRAFT_806954 [Macrolepiota fuliginosa MF-IS2]|uniref:Uncharacterized protein n=1 Tax=Macrolepiota fuliginosa MF-IS2 TaxID=1400762 RepID=A0A9P5X582_9AGAR|nr:hypothetical protein P691DRAFT_806954 [Macrolepiota fuliginosa MF-IS2]
MLYHLISSDTVYIRNFSDREDVPLYPHTLIYTLKPVQRIEVTLIHGQPTNIKHLIELNRNAFFTGPLVCSRENPFRYVAQIDYSLLRSPRDISRLVDSLSCHRELLYHLAFTNIVQGVGSWNAALRFTSSGTARLKLPIHAFADDRLVSYFSKELPGSLAELSVHDNIPIDATTYSRARRFLAHLIQARAYDIREATLPVTLAYLHKIVPNLPRLYNLTLTNPYSTSIDITRLEPAILSSLSSRSSNITILTLPASLLTPRIGDSIATRLSRLQELRIVDSDNSPNIRSLRPHRPGDFKHLTCLTFSGTLPQLIILLSTLFQNPASIIPSTTRTASTSSSYDRKFINLTVHVPHLTSKCDVERACAAINTYIPRVDIVKMHVKSWDPGEPKDGRWWVKSPVSANATGDLRLPGKVMTDFTHPCGKEVGSKHQGGHGKGFWARFGGLWSRRWSTRKP